MSAILAWKKQCNNFSPPRKVVDQPADVWNEVAGYISAQALCVDFVFVVLLEDGNVGFAGGMVGFGGGMPARACVIVVLGTVVALEVFVPVLHAKDFLVVFMIDMLTGLLFGGVSGIAVVVLADMATTMLEATIIVLKSMPMLASSEETSRAG